MASCEWWAVRERGILGSLRRCHSTHFVELPKKGNSGPSQGVSNDGRAWRSEDSQWWFGLVRTDAAHHHTRPVTSPPPSPTIDSLLFCFVVFWVFIQLHCSPFLQPSTWFIYTSSFCLLINCPNFASNLTDLPVWLSRCLGLIPVPSRHIND